MVYASGEIPIVGDRIEDKEERQATVIAILQSPSMVVRWDEGGVGLEYASDEFTLITRAMK